MWGVFWLPLRWFDSEGVGGAWVSLIFNAMAMLSATALAAAARRVGRASATRPQRPAAGQRLLALYREPGADGRHPRHPAVLPHAGVEHACGLVLLPRTTELQPASWRMVMGFAGLAAVLGIRDGIPLPRNAGDWLALASGMCWAAGTCGAIRRPTRRSPCRSSALPLGGLRLLCSGPRHRRADGAAAGRSPVTCAAMLPWIMLLGLIIFVPPNFLVLWAAQRIDSGARRHSADDGGAVRHALGRACSRASPSGWRKGSARR